MFLGDVKSWNDIINNKASQKKCTNVDAFYVLFIYCPAEITHLPRATHQEDGTKVESVFLCHKYFPVKYTCQSITKVHHEVDQ